MGRLLMGTSKRICKDCSSILPNGYIQRIRCKECQEKYYKSRSKEFLENKELNAAALGTTDFKAHRKKDFKKEAAEIKKEMKNLGLR